MSYYTELMRAVVADGRKWYRTNSHGETTEQPPFVVVHVALAEHRINASEALLAELETRTGKPADARQINTIRDRYRVSKGSLKVYRQAIAA